jgi:hypothetical protein
MQKLNFHIQPIPRFVRIAREMLATVCLLAVFATLSSTALAQSGKGLIAGTVIDPAGAAVPGAELRLDPFGVTVVSNGEGAFRLPEVLPGNIRLQFPTSVLRRSRPTWCWLRGKASI